MAFSLPKQSTKGEEGSSHHSGSHLSPVTDKCSLLTGSGISLKHSLNPLLPSRQEGEFTEVRNKAKTQTEAGEMWPQARERGTLQTVLP